MSCRGRTQNELSSVYPIRNFQLLHSIISYVEYTSRINSLQYKILYKLLKIIKSRLVEIIKIVKRGF